MRGVGGWWPKHLKLNNTWKYKDKKKRGAAVCTLYTPRALAGIVLLIAVRY